MKTKLCIIVSSNMTIRAFMINHLKMLSEYFEITIIMDEYIDFKEEYGLNIKVMPIYINRKINLFDDLKSLYKVYSFISSENFDIVLSITPKAGLIAMLSSFFANTKVRIHFFTGQVWATKKGFMKQLLKFADKIISLASTNILVDSASQRDFIISEGIVNVSKSSVLHKGSISGVDLDKFKSSPKVRKKLREKYNITNELVFIFLGRLNKDKGILDLAEVFNDLIKKYNDIKLFIVGPEEGNIENDISYLLNNKNVIRIGYVSNPEEILNVADVLVLPSYREGFGSIVVEAAAIKIPTIGSNIYGLSDAIVDNQTGLLHEKANIEDMKIKYEKVILSRELVAQYSEAAYDRVIKDFSSDTLSKALVDYLLEIKNK